ncbi:ABC transporter ATP-binding protein [Trichothermofontia sp.]
MDSAIDTVDQSLASKEIVLTVDQVSKKFCRSLKRSLMYGIQDIGSEILGLGRHSDTLRKGEFWALQQVSLTLKKGEALGLVGSNGSGKTTLLRIISGLIKPDTGKVKVKGRVAPLIALGAGFNPVLTGRENIYANMSILGLSNREIRQQFDQVVDFAEIGEAIDAPVHSYSSGMAARLGFACAVHTQPNILLIDEVLAVGDVKFRLKCDRKLRELKDQGTSFILVSHNAYTILAICSSAIYLKKGEAIFWGDTHTAMQRYEEDLFIQDSQKITGQFFRPEKDLKNSNGLDITGLFFREDGHILETSPCSGQPVDFCIRCRAREAISRVSVRIAIRDLSQEEGDPLLFFNSYDDQVCLDLPAGEHEICVRMLYLGLGIGTYTMRVFIAQGDPPAYTLDRVDYFRFAVRKQPGQGKAQFYQPHSWSLQSEQ